MNDFKVIKAANKNMDTWNRYVLDHPSSNVYQLYQWKKIIEETYLHTSNYYMAVSNDGKVLGILPFVKINTYQVAKNFTSIPYFDLGGVLGNHREIEISLVEKMLDLASNERAKVVCLRQENELNSFNSISSKKYPQKRVKKDKVRLILKLEKSSEDMFSSFKSKLRSQIRRPIKDGFYVKRGKEELIDDFYKVFSLNMKFLGSPVHSKKLIKNTLKNLPDSASIFVGYKKHTPVACSLVLGFKDTVYNPWASSLREYSKSSPNMLLYWEMIKFAANSGYKRFDFGRSSPNQGTYKFKKQWGAEDVDIFWYIFSKKRANSNGSFKLRKFFSNNWRHLPLGITTFLGPKIRKFISL